MSEQYAKTTLLFAILSMVIYLLSLSFIQFPLTTLLRPIPLIFLILFSLRTGNLWLKNLLLAALGFSLLGDIVLTLPFDLALQIGILLFILAQCAYILLFLKNAQFQNKRFSAFLAIMSLTFSGFYYLYPYLAGMQIPVLVYTCWLSAMIFCALHVKQHSSLINIGTFLFLFHAFIFGMNQFIFAGDKLITILVMYLYYAAQFLLVLGVVEMSDTLRKAPQPHMPLQRTG